jgi:uncharacterized protein with FMN-binding domain
MVSAGRRNAAVFFATAATVGLLFFYPTSTNRGDAQSRPGSAIAPAGVVPPSTGAGASPDPGTAKKVVVNGSSVGTPYGPVQVQLTIVGSKIVSAVAIDYPQGGGRDREINSIAIPLLQQETVAAQSAQIDTISGATYTSDGYVQSLQSALDAAHLG